MKTGWVGSVRALLALGLLGAGLAPACAETTTPGDNSETHFLITCEESCDGGLECICGVCTKPCSSDTGCGDLGGDATCNDSCDGATSTKICDVACTESADCNALGAAFACYGGRCRTEPEP